MDAALSCTVFKSLPSHDQPPNGTTEIIFFDIFRLLEDLNRTDLDIVHLEDRGNETNEEMT